MKLYIYIMLILFTLSGCGGGGGDSSSSASSFDGNFPTQDFSGASYEAWDYIIPANNLQENSIDVNSVGSTNYSANFTFAENITTEIPDNAHDEKIVYEKLTDRVKISFYKSDEKTFSYEMKKKIHIGETTTVLDSACILIAHHQKYNIYDDVIQIDCGKSQGFYQKGKGQIAQQ